MENERSVFHEKKEMRIERRPATKDDLGLARKMHHAAYRDVVIRQFGSWDNAVQDKFFEAEWANGSHQILLCDGEPCGYASTEESGKRLFLKELVIAPEFQSKGIGTRLLNEALETAKSKNLRLVLQVLKENEAAALYRKMGFEDAGESDTHFEMIFDPNKK